MGDRTFRAGLLLRTGGRPDRPLGQGRQVAVLQVVTVRGQIARVWVVGFVRYARQDLERLQDKNTKLHLRVFGILQFADDVSPRLRNEVIAEVQVTGWFDEGHSRPSAVTT